MQKLECVIYLFCTKYDIVEGCCDEACGQTQHAALEPEIQVGCEDVSPHPRPLPLYY
jgi:hypothetical protein